MRNTSHHARPLGPATQPDKRAQDRTRNRSGTDRRCVQVWQDLHSDLTVTLGTGFLTVGAWIVIDALSADGGAELVQVSSASGSTSIPIASTPLRVTHAAGATVQTCVISRFAVNADDADGQGADAPAGELACDEVRYQLAPLSMHLLGALSPRLGMRRRLRQLREHQRLARDGAAMSTPVSDWWRECLALNSTATTGDAQIHAETTPNKRMLVNAINGAKNDDALPKRRQAACDLATLATDVWISKESAAHKRSHTRYFQRVSAGVSAGVATGSGIALAVGLIGTAAKIFGIAVVFLGFLSGVVGAVWPEADYVRNRAKASHYEGLWRDIWSYAKLTLPTVDPASIDDAYKRFSAAKTAISDL